MRIEILGRKPNGTCDLSRKKGVEVWLLAVDAGHTQHVSTQRLPEVLRILCSVGDAVGMSAKQSTDSSSEF